MTGPFPHGKDFATLQARAALAGRSLLKVADHRGGLVVILLDGAGQPHRLTNVDQLEAALIGAEPRRVPNDEVMP